MGAAMLDESGLSDWLDWILAPLNAVELWIFATLIASTIFELEFECLDMPFWVPYPHEWLPPSVKNISTFALFFRQKCRYALLNHSSSVGSARVSSNSKSSCVVSTYHHQNHSQEAL